MRAFVGLLVLVGHSEPSRAEEPGAESTSARAIELGNEGVTFYERGEWAPALERFRDAEATYHSPVFMLYEARSLRNAGRFLEARKAFRRLAGETLAASAPDLWKQAQADGRDELRALETNIPSAVVSVEGGSPETRVTFDDRPIVLGNPIEFDPGTHHVVVTDRGRTEHKTFTSVAGKRRRRIVFRLHEQPEPKPLDEHAMPSGRGGPSVPGVVVAALGGTLMIAGGVVGWLALRKKEDIRDDLPAGCVGTTCPESQKSDIESRVDVARNRGVAADVLLIGGAATVLVGVGLIVFAPSGGPAIKAGVSQQGAFVRGRF